MTQFLASRLRPFSHHGFRLFFFAQTFSLVGTWAHDLARAWLVIQTMGSATALGSLLLAISLPGLFLYFHGGVLADRVDVKKIMIWTKSILAILSLGLALAVEFWQVQMWMLLVFGVIEGCVLAFDGPTFQALTVRMVPREDFQQAIALNSTNFHAGRMLGPVVAGALMHFHGPSTVFLFDAISYLGVVFILSRLNLRHVQKTVSITEPGAKLIREGIKYVFNDRGLRYMMLQLILTICIVMPLMMVILRTFMAHKFSLSGDEFGFLFMFPAMGSMLGAVSFTIFQPRNPMKALQYGVPLGVLSMLSIPYAPTPLIAAGLMAVTGFSTYLSLASLTVSLHLTVNENFRGRMSSLISLGFGSIGPLLSFPVGFYSDMMGANQAIIALTAVFAVGSAGLAFLNRFYARRAPLPPPGSPG